MPRQLRVYAAMPALSLSGGTNDRVVVPNPLTFGAGTAFTYCQWVRQRSAPTNGWGSSKGSGIDTLVYFANWFTEVPRVGTTSNTTVTDAALFPDTNWTCIISTYDETNGIRIYRGTQTKPLVDLFPYASQTVGSGSTTTDSSSLNIGNRPSASQAPSHDIAWAALFPVVLSLQDMRSWQDTPRSAVGKITGKCWQLGVDGTAVVRESGGQAAFNGAVIGTTILRATGPVQPTTAFHRLGRQPVRRVG